MCDRVRADIIDQIQKALEQVRTIRVSCGYGGLVN